MLAILTLRSRRTSSAATEHTASRRCLLNRDTRPWNSAAEVAVSSPTSSFGELLRKRPSSSCSFLGEAGLSFAMELPSGYLGNIRHAAGDRRVDHAGLARVDVPANCLSKLVSDPTITRKSYRPKDSSSWLTNVVLPCGASTRVCVLPEYASKTLTFSVLEPWFLNHQGDTARIPAVAGLDGELGTVRSEAAHESAEEAVRAVHRRGEGRAGG